MTISVAGTPSAPTETNGGTTVARDCGTCATDELLNIKVSGVADTFTPTAGQVTQTSGGGTLGAVSLDVSAIGNNGDGGFTFSAQWSAIVTNGGTITATAAGFPSGAFLSISHQRIPSTVGWDGSRVAATNGQHTATDGASALSTGNATSTAEAIFVAGLALNNGAAVTVTTPGGWTAITNNGGNGASAEVLAHAYRIETSGTTQACAWTYTALDGSSYNGQAATVVAYQEAAVAPNTDFSAALRDNGAGTFDGKLDADPPATSSVPVQGTFARAPALRRF